MKSKFKGVPAFHVKRIIARKFIISCLLASILFDPCFAGAGLAIEANPLMANSQVYPWEQGHGQYQIYLGLAGVEDDLFSFVEIGWDPAVDFILLQGGFAFGQIIGLGGKVSVSINSINGVIIGSLAPLISVGKRPFYFSINFPVSVAFSVENHLEGPYLGEPTGASAAMGFSIRLVTNWFEND